VKSVAAPQDYEAWRKNKIKAKVEEKTKSRLSLVDTSALPQVNREVAERLLQLNKNKKSVAKKNEDDEDDENDDESNVKKRVRKPKKKEGEAELTQLVRTVDNPLGDDRFKRMFTSEDFEVSVVWLGVWFLVLHAHIYWVLCLYFCVYYSVHVTVRL
jgi:ribosome biogenesis protein ENP2